MQLNKVCHSTSCQCFRENCHVCREEVAKSHLPCLSNYSAWLLSIEASLTNIRESCHIQSRRTVRAGLLHSIVDLHNYIALVHTDMVDTAPTASPNCCTQLVLVTQQVHMFRLSFLAVSLITVITQTHLLACWLYYILSTCHLQLLWAHHLCCATSQPVLDQRS